ncbi:tRNA methyltransferase [Pelagophyceae sp. CCMP2097]|nr:tRNA methyltransferase [Pelagophyceae sp. CCMP2097]
MARALIVAWLGAAAALTQKRPRLRRKLGAAATRPEFPLGTPFNIDGAFFRQSSRLSRDLAVLSASLLQRELGAPLAIVDAMAGAGTRSLRYARDVAGPVAGPVNVLANEGNDATQLQSNVNDLSPTFNGSSVTVVNDEANRVLARLCAEGTLQHIVDVDSFGLSFDAANALPAVLDGGLMHVASTGAAAAGARGVAARHAFFSRLGAVAVTCPPQNELGLRALLGRCAAVAAASGRSLEPVYATYTAAGPVFRVCARVLGRKSGAKFSKNYNFILSCQTCGHATIVPWASVGCAVCGDCGERSRGGDVAGPLWTGTLHNRTALLEMRADAEKRGWLDDGCAHVWTRRLGTS